MLAGFVTGLSLAYGSWTALCIGMDRHYADIHGRGKAPEEKNRMICRLLGTIGLLLTLFVCVKLQGWSVGAVMCIGTMTAGALLLTLLLTYAPEHVVSAGKLATAVSVLSSLLWLLA